MCAAKGVELKNKYAKAGAYLDDGDSTWFTLVEDFGAHMEVPCRYDSADPKIYKLVEEHIDESNKAVTDWHLGIGEFECGFFLTSKGELHEYAGPRTMNYHLWVKKIKKMLDPNLVCESSSYPTPTEEE